MRRLTLATLLAAAGIFCLIAPATQAQTATTGQVVGVVTDPSGFVVAGAKVVLTSDAGVRREAPTGGNGRYTFPLLDPGAYRLEVIQTGFASAQLEGIVVKITESTVVDVALKVATAPTTVMVTGESPLVQTESSARGTVIDESQVRDLPLPTRNFQQLLALTTGTSGSIQNSSDLGRGDAAVYVNGQRALSNSVVINGVDANSIGTGSMPNLAVPSIDSLQEFIVQTSMYDASAGRNAGGAVAAVTKSGSNKFHGDLYEFLRNTDLDGNNFFLNSEGTPRPTYDRNQFGGTLGGPLVKDRAWFFISYQGTRETNGTSLTNSLSTMFLPAFLGSERDPASLAALSMCYNPTFLGYVDPVAAAALTATLPNGQYMIPSIPGVTTGNCPTGASVSPVVQTIPSNSTYKEDQFNTNLDVKLNNSNRFFAKYFFAANRTVQALYDQFGDGNPLQAPGWPTEEDVDQRLLSVGVTSMITTHLLNEVRFGWSTIYGPGKPSQPITSTQLGIASPLSTLFPGMPTMSFTNMFTLGPSPLASNYAATNTYSGGDMMTWIKGRHTLKFGGEYKRQELDAPYFDVFPNGELFYLGFTGNPFGDFLAGLTGASVIGSGTNSLHNRANDFSAFFQDDWKVAPRLTLNLGLRYDYFGPTTETDGHFVGFDPTKAVTTPLLIPGLGLACPATPSTCGSVVTGGFVQAGNGNLPGFPKVGNGLVNPNYKNFGPRLGFAYQATDNGRVVVRGGYGIFFDRPNMRLYNSQLFNMPYEMMAAALATPNENPFVQVPQPSAFPLDPLSPSNAGIFPFGGYPAFLPVQFYGTTAPIDFPIPATGLYPDLKDWSIPYVQTFNLGVQTSFANNWMLDVGYVGSEGRKFPRLFSFNQANTPTTVFGFDLPALVPPSAGSLGGPFYPGFSNLTAPGLGSFLMESNSNSNYNSLQVTLNKRLAQGLQMLLSYTWSHSLDDYSGSDVSDIGVIPGNMVDEQSNYASSDFDRRQRFVASYLYNLPDAYHGGSGFAKKALNSWSLSGIVTLQSGMPFSIFGRADAFEATRADLVTGRTLASAIKSGNVEDRLSAYFDPTAFMLPPAFTPDWGQLGRNIIRGPKQINTDLSIMKFIPVTESQRVEFRAEFFNLFNNVNFANPVSIIYPSSNFGSIVSTSTGPRVIQFALKYAF
ncbi:Cna protein B-type domain, TonB-dependent Receptor Plug Domain protein [Candidatus Sulfotelmatobacter kueseliae]|uniref:Cna protein B-type domain, TonB-dependent Receptor Plug Domain protein n=1 Tax=Candidatus Sulfotelmatobacter kueseliae TaxID=2042962 RepID=A0A2U3LAC9_9BACT|nr:Cna protein B-type domain, TonB-dependent Receptor Plug Domain protein [Candidatus Sulfotelmatobacter kueseliae]